MDTLHHMLRTLRRETKQRPDHTAVFREFIRNIERLGMTPPPAAKPKGKALTGKVAAGKPRAVRKTASGKPASSKPPAYKAPSRKR